MLLSQEKFNKIANQFSILLLPDDAEQAFDFVHAVMSAEADAIRERYPYATASIGKLEAALYEIFSIGGDIAGENFNEG